MEIVLILLNNTECPTLPSTKCLQFPIQKQLRQHPVSTQFRA